MINSLVRIGITCPCDIEYQSCKEILKLYNETELAGRLISSRREKDVEVIQEGGSNLYSWQIVWLAVKNKDLTLVIIAGNYCY